MCRPTAQSRWATSVSQHRAISVFLINLLFLAVHFVTADIETIKSYLGVSI